MGDEIPIHGHVRLDWEMASDSFRAGGGWRSRAVMVFLLTLIAVLVVAQMLDNRVTPPAVAITCVVLAVAGRGIWTTMTSASRRFDRLSTAELEMDYVFDARGMTLRDGTGTEGLVPWSNMRHAREWPRGILIKTGQDKRYIPFKAFAAQDLPRLRALIARHITLAPQ